MCRYERPPLDVDPRDATETCDAVERILARAPSRRTRESNLEHTCTSRDVQMVASRVVLAFHACESSIRDF